jgi:wyosine [tRNA(Phe)-imidazoG37] synthetase (radical SAM superfamily)
MKSINKNKVLEHIYGPVPSRRLGFSLGVDIIPYKTCTLDCIYCQLGATTQKTFQRKPYFTEREIVSQVEKAVNSGQRIDYITFSGSGEPTLNTLLGPIIRKIKKKTNIPVAVLTNGTLLCQEDVRKDLLAADLVVPSLDAATQEVFEQTNRPHSSLKIQSIIEGQKKFRQEFKGEVWLEILLVSGVNDSPDHIQKLKEAADKIRPDKIHLNTVIRPPAQESAHPLTPKEMEKIRDILGERAKIIAEFDKIQHFPGLNNLKETILAMIQRRPVTLSDMAASLGKHKNELIKTLDRLLKERKIKSVLHKGRKYYEPASSLTKDRE